MLKSLKLSLLSLLIFSTLASVGFSATPPAKVRAHNVFHVNKKYDPTPQTFKVLAFNIWQEGSSISEGFESVAQIIHTLSPDVVALVEVRNYGGVDFTARLCTRLGELGSTYYGNSGTTNNPDTTIISKMQPDTKATTYLNTGSCTIVHDTYTIAGHKIAFYAAHLNYKIYTCYIPRNSYYEDTSLDNSMSLDELLALNLVSGRPASAEAFHTHNATYATDTLVFLAGDFNEPSHLDWVESTKNLFEHSGRVIPWQTTKSLEDNGYIDSFRAIYPDPVTHPGISWPSGTTGKTPPAPAWVDADHDERDRIDYVFYRPNPSLKLISSKVVGPASHIALGVRTDAVDKGNFMLEDTVNPGRHWPSDHHAVLSTFEVIPAK